MAPKALTVVVGLGLLAVAAQAGAPAAFVPGASAFAVAHSAPVPKQDPDPVKLDLARLQGKWRRVGLEHCGRTYTAEELKRVVLVWEIKGEAVIWRNTAHKEPFETALKIDPTTKLKALDLGPIRINGKPQNPQGNTVAERGSVGIYELKDDTLRVCYGPGGPDGKERPKAFKTVPQNPVTGEGRLDPHEIVIVFERIKDAEPGK